jgi:hypothetical protein
MAGDPLKKVQAGEQLRIPAEAYNAFVDAVRSTRSQQTLGADAQGFLRQTTLAKVKNLSGANRERFSILALDGPIIAPEANETEFLRQTTFGVVLPAAGHEGRFAVLLEPLGPEKIGVAAVAGVVPVKLFVNPLTLYDHAEIWPGSSEVLHNVPHGSARVLWVEPTGEMVRWAVVRIDDGDYEAHVLVTSNIPDGSGMFPGLVQKYVGGAWVTLFPCKAVDVNG